MPLAGTKQIVVKIRKPVEGKLPANWSIQGPANLHNATLWNPSPEVKAHTNGHAAAFFFARWNSRAGRWSIGNPAPKQEW